MAWTIHYAEHCMILSAPDDEVSGLARAASLRRSVFLAARHCTPLFSRVHGDTPSPSPGRAILLVSAKMIRGALRDKQMARAIRRCGGTDAKRDERRQRWQGIFSVSCVLTR